jgi:hypothetical protein
MQCLACGAEMHLEQVVADGTMPIPGFEHHTFVCPACGDVERRRVFNKHVTRTHADPVLLPNAPPISAPITIETEEAAAVPFVKRVFAKVVAVRHSIRRKKASPFATHSAEPQTLAPPAEPAPEASFEPLPERIPELLSDIVSEAAPNVYSPTDKNLDECGKLLERAIEMVKETRRSSQGTAALIELTPPITEIESPLATHSAEPQTLPDEPVLAAQFEPPPERMPELLNDIGSEAAPNVQPISSSTDKSMDECGVLLARTIEMVKEPRHSPQGTATFTELTPNITKIEPMPLMAETNATQIERISHVVVVQIQHDPKTAKFVAKDTNSGLSVLRHEDSAWLRTMCDRLGWQIVDAGD